RPHHLLGFYPVPREIRAWVSPLLLSEGCPIPSSHSSLRRPPSQQRHSSSRQMQSHVNIRYWGPLCSRLLRLLRTSETTYEVRPVPDWRTGFQQISSSMDFICL